MKYMGHKGKLLPVISEIVRQEARNASRIGDPFCGSAAVSWHFATNFDQEVISGDLQTYGKVLAAAVVERDEKLVGHSKISSEWLSRADVELRRVLDFFPNDIRSSGLNDRGIDEIKAHVTRCRRFCAEVLPTILRKFDGTWPISKAYGAFYYSPYQALQIDAFLRTAPKTGPERTAAVAALISAASRCAAAPGHTAQPFQPTDGAANHIAEAWNRDLASYVRDSMSEIAELAARTKGRACRGDFRVVLRKLKPGDVLFADPPYSGVHYSRFYHVLETIATGNEFSPEGAGRYPPLSSRPSSEFSQKTRALAAANRLLRSSAERNVNVVLTFPITMSGNGLSVDDFINLGGSYFSNVTCTQVDSFFSTLGGNLDNRKARIASKEAIVCFRV